MESTYKIIENHSISTAKATRLFWLGRYAERIYLSLHQIRIHFDLMIDEDDMAYIKFCDKMGIENKYLSSDDFMHKYIFDASNPDSIINMMEMANDNAILLREEITSETLSYIQLSICFMKSIEDKAKNINTLQLITDYMFAFWGSLEERILSSQILYVVKFGKYMESLDLHLRFNYPFDRIEQIYSRMLESIDKECYICDEITLISLKQQINFEKYKEPKTLSLLNNLFSPKN